MKSSDEKKVLFVSGRFPFPLHKGDQLVLFNNIRLVSQKYKVTLITFYDNESELENLHKIKKYCEKVVLIKRFAIFSYINIIFSIFRLEPMQVSYYRSGLFKKKLNLLLSVDRFDLIHVYMLRMAHYVKDIPTPKVIGLIDSMHLNMSRRALNETGLKKVIFKYPEQALNAIEDVSFTISAGEKVGVIGRIGSGKTTLQKLILSLYEPEEGAVLIDGIDLRQIDPVDLRKAIGYVPQDLFLFQGTIKENIVAGHPRASDAEILVAAKLSGLDDFVSVHPLGYDMPVGERGESLSGGQRQTVVLARSLIHNPSILLFDEPTNAMDSRSEEQFKKRMELVLADKTMVLVTHRASLLSMVDRILVMDQGRLLADGPRDAVLEAIASGKITINEG